jgi:hypothetical protein
MVVHTGKSGWKARKAWQSLGRGQGEKETEELRDWERPARVFPKGCLWQENLLARMLSLKL